jgi:hypothetical protein
VRYDLLVSPVGGRAEQILEALAGAHRPRRPVSLDPRYLEAIVCLETSPQCRAGTDKTWVLSTLCGARRLRDGARRLR